MKTKNNKREGAIESRQLENEKNKKKSQCKAPFRAGNEKKSPQQKKRIRKNLKERRLLEQAGAGRHSPD